MSEPACAATDTGRPAAASVVVVGSLNVDVLLRVRHLPAPGETVAGSGYDEQPGGKGANQAVAAARAGAAVRLIGMCGDDDAAALSLAALAREGVDVTGVLRSARTGTGRAFVVTAEAGENQIIVLPGANAELDAAATATALASFVLSERDVIVVSFEIGDAAAVVAAQAAAPAGARLVVNPAPVRPLPAAVVAAAPVLTPNASEARALSGARDLAGAARHLAGRTGAAVVVTDGAEGVIICSDSGLVELPAPAVSAVDTTGAGDTFTGVLAAGLAGGLGVIDAAQRGVVAASLSVRAAGARPGMPTGAEIDEHLVRYHRQAAPAADERSRQPDP